MKSMSLQSKIALYALLIALSFVLSYLESFVPYPVPGVKLGLTNLVVIIALYRFGHVNALVINIIRIVLSGITFGSLFSMVYGLAGGMLSFSVMVIMKKSGKFNIITVSMAGGIFHNIGQILIAVIVLKSTSVLSYLPVLWISGLAAGAIVGWLSGIIASRIPPFDKLRG